MPVYVVDTSIWIRLWRNHPPDIFAHLWAQLDASIAGGTVASPEEVLHELERGADDLAETLAVRQGLFVPLDQALMAAVAEVVAACPGLVDPDAERNRADPFVVALAKHRQGAVVTGEKPRGRPTAPPKIPDACAQFAIACLDWFGFLRAMDWQL